MMTISELDLSKSYSYAEYLTWQFKERVELIRGKILKMSPAPSREHQQISSKLHLQIGFYFENQPCEVYHAPFDVRLPIPKGKRIETVVQPDLCVICDLEKLDKQGCNGAPDWVLEILSPGNSQKEMGAKFEVYQESGVKEYWIVNPLDQVVFAYVLNEEGVFIGKKPMVHGDMASPTIFPELNIDLAKVFGERRDEEVYI